MAPGSPPPSEPTDTQPKRQAAKEIRKRQRAYSTAQHAIYSAHRGARAAASIFKALALLILAGGAIAAVQYAHWLHSNTGLNNGDIAGIVLAIVLSTVLSASLSAFFGYVLSLLVEIESNTRETAYNVRRGDIPAPPVRTV